MDYDPKLDRKIVAKLKILEELIEEFDEGFEVVVPPNGIELTEKITFKKESLKYWFNNYWYSWSVKQKISIFYVCNFAYKTIKEIISK